MKMTTDIPPQITTPDSVETRLGTLTFIDGFPDDATVQTVYDNLDFQRGVQAFLAAMPGASSGGDARGLARTRRGRRHDVPIIETLMDSKSLWLTANTDTVYASSWLDLKNGPMVIESPPNTLGIVDDFWFHYVTDVGNAGPDKGKGRQIPLPAARLHRRGAGRLLRLQLRHLRQLDRLAGLPRQRRPDTAGGEHQEAPAHLSAGQGRQSAAAEVHQRLGQ